jgi:hypothetical protein
VCAVSAALLAVPAGAAMFLVNDRVWATVGKGVEVKGIFRDAARMQRREPLIVDFDCSTPTTRSQFILCSSWEQTLALFFLSATSPTLTRL